MAVHCSINSMWRSLLEVALLLLPLLLLAIALTIRQRLPKDRRRCIGSKTQGDEETWVKSSNHCKLVLHIGCSPNAKEYPCCCLPIISSLCTALAHAHVCIQSLTWKPHFDQPWVNPGWTHFNPHQDMGWLQPGFNSDSSKEEFSADTLNPSSTWVQPGFKLQCGCALSCQLQWSQFHTNLLASHQEVN